VGGVGEEGVRGLDAGGGEGGGGGEFVAVTKSLSVSFSHEACEEDKLGWDFRTHNRLTIVWEVTT